MPNVNLNDDEIRVARELLEREAAELHEEIHRTDDRHYRDELKDEEKLLRDVLRKLKEAG